MTFYDQTYKDHFNYTYSEIPSESSLLLFMSYCKVVKLRVMNKVEIILRDILMSKFSKLKHSVLGMNKG